MPCLGYLAVDKYQKSISTLYQTDETNEKTMETIDVWTSNLKFHLRENFLRAHAIGNHCKGCS